MCMQRTEIRRIDFPQFILRECAYSPRLRLPRHAHDYSNVTVVIRGQIEEASGDHEYRGSSCSVVLKPAGCEHQNRVGGMGVRTLSIELARASAMEQEIGGRRWSWFEEAEIVRSAVALYRTTKGSNASDIEARAFDLLAAVLSAPAGRSSPPRWLSEITRVLEERFDEPLRFEEIAGDVGLHPVYLSRAFRLHMGISMSDYRRMRRLRQARDLLSTSHRNLAAIAAECGFTDSSHLCRTFSEVLDMTPNVYRRLCRQV